MLKMPKIFQKFDLVREQMEKLKREDRIRLHLPNIYEAGKTLKEELSNKGYDVLISNVSYGGVPESIILGGEFGKNHKDDFYSLAEKLGLFFRSGYFYVRN